MQEITGSLSSEPAEFANWKKKTAIFLSSQSLSLFGSMLVQYAIIWHITLTTHSGAILTIATLAGFLPQIVISLFAGVWADRYPRKFLIIAADLLTAASTLVLARVLPAGLPRAVADLPGIRQSARSVPASRHRRSMHSCRRSYPQTG